MQKVALATTLLLAVGSPYGMAQAATKKDSPSAASTSPAAVLKSLQRSGFQVYMICGQSIFVGPSNLCVPTPITNQCPDRSPGHGGSVILTTQPPSGEEMDAVQATLDARAQKLVKGRTFKNGTAPSTVAVVVSTAHCQPIDPNAGGNPAP